MPLQQHSLDYQYFSSLQKLSPTELAAINPRLSFRKTGKFILRHLSGVFISKMIKLSRKIFEALRSKERWQIRHIYSIGYDVDFIFLSKLYPFGKNIFIYTFQKRVLKRGPKSFRILAPLFTRRKNKYKRRMVQNGTRTRRGRNVPKRNKQARKSRGNAREKRDGNGARAFGGNVKGSANGTVAGSTRPSQVGVPPPSLPLPCREWVRHGKLCPYAADA